MATSWSSKGYMGFRVGISSSVSGNKVTLKALVKSDYYIETNYGEAYYSGGWGTSSKSKQSYKGPTQKVFRTYSITYTGSKTFNFRFKIPSLGVNERVSHTVKVADPKPASVPTLSSSTVTLGNSITIKTNRKDSSYTHNITAKFGSYSTTIGTGVANYISWKPKLSSHANQIKSSTSGTGTITVVTKDGSKTVGTRTVKYTAKLASDVKPSISSLTLSEASGNPYGYTQTRSSIRVKTASSGVYGSTIKSTNVTLNTAKRSGSDITVAINTGATSMKVTSTVTDSRGRTASTSKTVSVYTYADVSTIFLEGKRVNANTGIDDPFGSKGVVDYSFTLPESDIPGFTYTRQVHIMRAGTDTWTLLDEVTDVPYVAGEYSGSTTINDIPKDESVTVSLTVSTPLNVVSFLSDISVGEVPMSWSKSGVGIGKIWERGSLDVAGDTYFNGRFNFVPTGVIFPFAGSPSSLQDLSFLLCDGSVYSPLVYPELFEAIGNTYGGTTSAPKLPNLQQRVPVGAGSGYTLGSTGGEEKHTLTEAEMPVHHHLNGRTSSKYSGMILYKTNTGVSRRSVKTGGETYYSPTSTLYDDIGLGGGGSNTTAGGGESHNNMQPYTVVNYIIKT